jgi:hypothetical protein
LNLLLAIVGLGAAELWFRAKEPKVVAVTPEAKTGPLGAGNPEALVHYTEKGRRLIPNSEVVILNHGLTRQDVVMKINSLGFRDEEIPLKKPEGELRVLVLGDSITWGDYLQAEDVYVERIEHYLEQALPERTVQVINAGVGDIGLKEEIGILEEKGLSVEPDIVLIGFYMNDSRPPQGFAGEIGGRGWLRQHSALAEALYRNLKLKQYIKREGRSRFQWMYDMGDLDVKGDREQFLELAKSAEFDWGAAWQPESWRTVRSLLKDILSLARSHDFEVAVAIHPVSLQISADFLEDTPQREMRALCEDLGISCVDLLPIYLGHKHEAVMFDICHPTVLANDFIGRAIAEFLLAEMILPAN